MPSVLLRAWPGVGSKPDMSRYNRVKGRFLVNTGELQQELKIRTHGDFSKLKHAIPCRIGCVKIVLSCHGFDIDSVATVTNMILQSVFLTSGWSSTGSCCPLEEATSLCGS